MSRRSNASSLALRLPGRHAAAAAVQALLKLYKFFISPLFFGSCRFYPSCSAYMSEAVARYGVSKGVWLGIRRLSRCHPLGGHGVDPVPDA